MEFYSLKFVIFIALGILFHEILGRKSPDKQWVARLIISIAYYLILSKWTIIYILFTSGIVFFGGKKLSDIGQKIKELSKDKAIAKEDKKTLKQGMKNKRRKVLACLLLVNILTIVLFKINALGNYVNIAVPLGVSFYTFMAISYLIDIYGDKYEAEGNYYRLLLYLIWFPQLLQGPINRYDSQKETLYKKSDLTWDILKYALFLMLFGALKKYAIANPLVDSVDKIFDGGFEKKPGAYLSLGAVLFAVQQYADFSGGIDMMLAVSLLFGVKMSDNFRQPYFSRSISQFWRRWHISLGAFMRDYVFYPFTLFAPVRKLMGKINTKYGNYVARSVIGGLGNIIVFILVGAWHGFAMHYIIWGLYNGIIIAVSDALTPVYKNIKKTAYINDNSKGYRVFQIARTFILIVLAGYFDRISDVSGGVICLKNTFLHFAPELSGVWIKSLYEWEVISNARIMLVIASLSIVIIDSILRERQKGNSLYKILGDRSIIVRWGTIYAMIILLMASFIFTNGNIEFMYEQF